MPIAIKSAPNMLVKMDGKVSGSITTGFSYEYGCKFKGGIGYYNGDWKGIGSFEETANEFRIIPARAEFELSTGVGLYLGADIMIYGVAGPEFAVGPRLGGKLEAAFKPFEAPEKHRL